MKLKSASVHNFKSIVESDPVLIEDGVTVLIGKNEQGKTTFLKALASFNEDRTYSDHDFPSHLRPTLVTKSKAEIPMVTLEFEIGNTSKGHAPHISLQRKAG